VSFPPDLLVARGIEGIRKANIAAMKAMAGGKLEITESHQIPFHDVVVGWGLWRFTMPVPGGTPVEMVGRYTDVKAKRDGKWVYLVDHASAVPMPAETPAAEAPKK
jgi:ketosteroid isomerase-like protein